MFDAYGNIEYGATGASANIDCDTLVGVGDLLHGGHNDPINTHEWAATRDLLRFLSIYKYHNLFEHSEQHSQKLYKVEVLLRRVGNLADCK